MISYLRFRVFKKTGWSLEACTEECNNEDTCNFLAWNEFPYCYGYSECDSSRTMGFSGITLAKRNFIFSKKVFFFEFIF